MGNLLEKIQSERRLYRINDLVDIKYGFGLPERDRRSGTVPVYGSSGIVGYHNEPKVAKPAIIIGRKGNVGSVYLSKIASFPIDTSFFIDETKDGFDLSFVYYLLQKINLPKYGGDSAVPGLSRDAVYSLEVKAPSYISQKKIAEILGAYDAKIENNNKIIKNLEAAAQTIFDEWFVKFRFPGYEKVKFVKSEMGEIPEGWKIKRISNFGHVICGKTPPTSQSEYFGGQIPFIKIPDMHGQLFITKTQDSLTEIGVVVQKNKTLPRGSICVSCIATVGLVSITTKTSQTNQQINTLVPKNKKYLEYLYFILKNKKKDLQAIGSGGSTTLNINTAIFSNVEVIEPDQKVISYYNLKNKSIFAKMESLFQENSLAKELQNQLLLKLI